MKKNLKGRVVLIFAVLLVCLYGIFRIPHGVSGKALMDALTENIHLGLDLKGGAHLILHVQVSEAVSEETDNTVARVQQDLKTAKVTFSRALKPDPANKPTAVEIDGIAPASVRVARSTLDTNYSNEYDGRSRTNSTGTFAGKPSFPT